MRIRTITAGLLLCFTLKVWAQEPKFQTGLRFLEPNAYASIPLAAPIFAGPLPEQVELAPFATPGDQGQQGSCVGWAVAYALKTYQEERERHWGVATAEHQFSPSFIYNQIKVGDCMGGSLFTDALNLLTRDGVSTLQQFRYSDKSCDQLPSDAARQHATEFRVASWRRVNVQDETEVKTHLAAGFPVLIGMPVDSAFMNLQSGAIYQGLVGQILGGHAMVLTGYDNARGAFKLLNSWGDKWSTNGTGWISYPAARKTIREAYVVQDIVVAGPTVQSNPTIDLETVVLAEAPAGSRSTTKTTGNHHCSSNCAGEPTRTNYTLTLVADEGAFLRNPKLRCVSGPCEGWFAVIAVKLENEGRRAIASWDVWSLPTTWELTADEVRIAEVSRFTRHVPLGAEFQVVGQTGAPPPRISGKLPSGESFSFVAGQSTFSQYLRFVSTEVQGPDTIYRYQSGPP